MKPFCKSPIGLSRPVNIFFCGLATLLIFVLTPKSALSQDDHHHHGGETSELGGEYRVEEKPMEHHHDEGAGSDLFRTRGSHDDLGSSKPEMMMEEGLLARGHNIYLHMCVFCHGQDGNGGGPATDYLYPWPRDFRKGIFKFRSTPTDTFNDGPV